MLDRNRRIKPHPERFQSTTEQFNLILTCEERVYDQVIESNNEKFVVISEFRYNQFIYFIKKKAWKAETVRLLLFMW